MTAISDNLAKNIASTLQELDRLKLFHTACSLTENIQEIIDKNPNPEEQIKDIVTKLQTTTLKRIYICRIGYLPYIPY